MKAPDKIYLDEDESWHLTNPNGDSVEYTRTDAFIEKAVEWLKNHYRDYMHNPTGCKLEAFFGGDMCNDFEDYMKGRMVWQSIE